MDRLSENERRGATIALVAFVCVGCPSAPKDGPPPEESLAIASAAPRALGALAAGTDAAPRALASPGPLRTDPDDPLPDPDGEDPDGGAASPDAGSSAPEDLPL